MPDCLRLSLWCSPRNVSTALMYSFAQRADTEAIDEPLYGHYLRVSAAPHPGAAEVMAAMDCDGERVVREVLLGDCGKPVRFFKNMTHHLLELDLSFLSHLTNILLTRHPREMLPSLAEQLETPTLRDTGYKAQVELLELLQSQGQEPPVLDSKELLLNPEGVLTELCARIGIPFDPAMLAWSAGAKPEDGVWARYWYSNVHASTGFSPYRPKNDPFPERLEPLLNECLPYYETLSRYAIRAKEGAA